MKGNNHICLTIGQIQAFISLSCHAPQKYPVAWWKHLTICTAPNGPQLRSETIKELSFKEFCVKPFVIEKTHFNTSSQWHNYLILIWKRLFISKCQIWIICITQKKYSVATNASEMGQKGLSVYSRVLSLRNYKQCPFYNARLLCNIFM